uniref:Uncharacterized protein n=1 Tax=uncultured marine thaumarchaeote KM3_199_C08 TaxID=1456090 RepID=A0A075GTK2_9ARCH|nr:hypothetical protein [uncultured marine thaumarchaeote KM3_199_C08]
MVLLGASLTIFSLQISPALRVDVWPSSFAKLSKILFAVSYDGLHLPDSIWFIIDVLTPVITANFFCVMFSFFLSSFIVSRLGSIINY